MDQITKETLLEQPVYKNLMNDLANQNHKPLLVCLGGSHAYGTNVEGSDVDVRGIYLNSESELLGIYPDKEQHHISDGDATIYSLKKAVWLMKECNPAMLEILGVRNDDILIDSEEAKVLRNNIQVFLSKKATKTFGGYARSQLNRLINRSGRAKQNLADNEERSFEKSFLSLQSRYKHYIPESASIKQENDKLLLSFSVKDMPVDEVSNILNEFNSIDRSYRRSTRNDKAAAHNKLPKHMMHLIRLYMMGIELMNDHSVHTFRDGSEHDLLMSIRRGDFLEDDELTPTKEFNELVDEYTSKYEEACDRTNLPDDPDIEGINNIVLSINKKNYAERRIR